MATLRYCKTSPDAFEPEPIKGTSAFVLKFPHDLNGRVRKPSVEVDLGLSVRISPGYYGRLEYAFKDSGIASHVLKSFIPSDEEHPIKFWVRQSFSGEVARGRHAAILSIYKLEEVTVLENCNCRAFFRKLTFRQ